MLGCRSMALDRQRWLWIDDDGSDGNGRWLDVNGRWLDDVVDGYARPKAISTNPTSTIICNLSIIYLKSKLYIYINLVRFSVADLTILWSWSPYRSFGNVLISVTKWLDIIDLFLLVEFNMVRFGSHSVFSIFFLAPTRITIGQSNDPHGD